jgi:hypothetical protein
MPAWNEILSVNDRWNLVAYLKTFADPNQIDPPLDQLESLPQEMRHTHQHWDPPLPDQ